MSQPSPHVAGFDVIGDVHGCAELLHRLLKKLGYDESECGYVHAQRKAIFLGDIIDRGPEIREVVTMVKAMVDAGNAYVVLGNHEYNALVYELFKANNSNIRRRERLRVLLEESLRQYEHYSTDWSVAIEWFKTLPLFLDFDDFRVVHACWDQEKINQLTLLNEPACLTDSFFLQQSTEPRTPENGIVERLLRGTDLKLPNGLTLTGSDGVVRHRFRTKFWTGSPESYGDVIFQPDRLPEEVEGQLLSADEKNQLVYYRKEEKPLFVGHYWRQGKPRPICSNIACLDYSAVKQGKLVAYRFNNGDTRLEVSKLWWVK